TRNKPVLVVRTLIHGVLNLVAHGPDDFKVQPANFDVLPGRRCALKDFLRCVVTEYHHAAVVGEVALIEVAPIRKIEFAHLAVRHIHASHLQGYNASSDLEPEIAVNLSAYRPHYGHFVANR